MVAHRMRALWFLFNFEIANACNQRDLHLLGEVKYSSAIYDADDVYGFRFRNRSRSIDHGNQRSRRLMSRMHPEPHYVVMKSILCIWWISLIILLAVNTKSLAAFLPLQPQFAAVSTFWNRHRNDERVRSRFLLASRDDEVSFTFSTPTTSTIINNNMFDSHLLHFDHYNGVTLTLNDDDLMMMMSLADFTHHLQASLAIWKTEQRKGIWIHLSPSHADKIPICIQYGFQFHMVIQEQLVLSQWLVPNTVSRLPPGPTHQVGVGCLILHPSDSSKMLVVQEKSGPAAANQLWKMPTGLTDPGEDVDKAAVRELKEETGLTAIFKGILLIRQAHPHQQSQTKNSSESSTNVIRRANSDLFFVCLMDLVVSDTDDDDDAITFQACPEEIAAIQWMSVKEYCQQERWQSSPIYKELNQAIFKASSSLQTAADDEPTISLFEAVTLPLGHFAPNATNTIYKSPL